MLRTVIATRYVTPLREGGSLPAIIEGDDGGLYVMKFVGAGQGPKALIAELVAGEIGRYLGLYVPEIVFVDLDPAIGRSEPDAEIQDLLQASVGLNLGLRYLPNALAFNMMLQPPSPDLASKIIWFDAYITNVDRTPRNVNLLIWQDDLWLIDHGASLYFHHSWDDYLSRSRSPFPLIKDHALISRAGALPEADANLRPQLNVTVLRDIIDLIPESWLVNGAPFEDSAAHRQGYLDYLQQRLAAAEIFVGEAIRAHTQLV